MTERREAQLSALMNLISIFKASGDAGFFASQAQNAE